MAGEQGITPATPIRPARGEREDNYYRLLEDQRSSAVFEKLKKHGCDDGDIAILIGEIDRGRMKRRHLVQALAALVLPTRVMAQDAAPAPAPIVCGLGVNHVQLTVSDIERSAVYYQKLFGVTKGWPTTDGKGIHLEFPNGYISLGSVAEKKGVISHFSVAIDHIDSDSGKRVANKISNELPDAKAQSAFQANDGATTVNLIDPDGIRVQISSKDGRSPRAISESINAGPHNGK